MIQNNVVRGSDAQGQMLGGGQIVVEDLLMMMSTFQPTGNPPSKSNFLTKKLESLISTYLGSVSRVQMVT